MNPFQYSKAATAAQARQSTTAQSAFIAGGTNLLDLMKKHIARPERLVDVTTALSANIESITTGLRIGAMARNHALAADARVQKDFPLLAKAIMAGASPQIRHMASTAGNLLQRTRCPYFYDPTTPCNKRQPGSGCSALQGEQRYAAIVGHSTACIATHPSDMCVALAALDAQVVVDNKGKISRIPFADFHRLPGDQPQLDTHLPAGALITHIDLPKNPFAQHHAYVKLRERDSYAFAIVSVAAALQLKGKTIAAARLASGGVAHKPWRWRAIEQFLQGKTANEKTFMEAAQMLDAQVKTFPGNAFKLPLLKGAMMEALHQASNA